MSDQLQYEIEINGCAATLYLAGGMKSSDLPFLRMLCATIPAFVRMLRVDLLVTQPAAPDATAGIREILQRWGDERRGKFKLSLRTSHLVATLHGDADRAMPAAYGQASLNPDALMAIYL